MVISLASILETFIDSVCGLAIESNPGVLINASKSLDGVSLLKTKRLEREVIENAIEDIAFSHPAGIKKAIGKDYAESGHCCSMYCTYERGRIRLN